MVLQRLMHDPASTTWLSKPHQGRLSVTSIERPNLSSALACPTSVPEGSQARGQPHTLAPWQVGKGQRRRGGWPNSRPEGPDLGNFWKKERRVEEGEIVPGANSRVSKKVEMVDSRVSQGGANLMGQSNFKTCSGQLWSVRSGLLTGEHVRLPIGSKLIRRSRNWVTPCPLSLTSWGQAEWPAGASTSKLRFGRFAPLTDSIQPGRSTMEQEPGEAVTPLPQRLHLTSPRDRVLHSPGRQASSWEGTCHLYPGHKPCSWRLGLTCMLFNQKRWFPMYSLEPWKGTQSLYGGHIFWS